MQGSPERTIPHLLGDTEMVSARITELAEGLEGSTGSPEVKQESVLCSAQARWHLRRTRSRFHASLIPALRSQRCQAQLQAWLFSAPTDCNYRQTPLIGFAARALRRWWHPGLEGTGKPWLQPDRAVSGALLQLTLSPCHFFATVTSWCALILVSC